VRLKPQAPWSAGLAMTLDSGVQLKGKAVDLKDASLTLKKGNKSGEMVSVTGLVEHLGAGTPTFKGGATLVLDNDVLALLREDLPPNLSLTGEARVKAAFSGTPSEFGWSIDMPLTGAGIDVEKAFRKPSGVAASVKASGKWAKETLTLDSGQISLPGVSAVARGTLLDRNGRFSELHADLKKTDLKDLAKFAPALAGLKVSGPIEADAILRSSRKGIEPHATIRLVSVDYVPEKANWSLRKLHGTAKTNGVSLEAPALVGQIQGAIEAPFRVKVALDNLPAVKDTSGRVSIAVEKGKIKAERLRSILQQGKILVGTLLNPQQALEKKSDVLELESLTADFDVKAGTAKTSNLKLKATDFSLGATGSLRLDDLNLDALAGLHTVIVSSDALGKIPQVRQAVKKYEGLLKITGLDKELKKIGIDTATEGQAQGEGAPQPESPTPKIVKTPVTVMVKITGPASSPNVTPVLENALDKNTADHLKELMK
jgi:hypothetical protein